MAVAGYLDQLSGFTADMLLGALIDAGADRNALEAALRNHHGVDCEINVAAGLIDRTRVTYASLSCVEASVPETFRAIPGGGAETPAGVLLGKVTGHLERNVNELCGAEGRAATAEELGGRHGALRILVLCNALHLHGIDAIYHEPLPFVAGIDATPPLLAALMRDAAIRPVGRAPVDLAGCAVLTAISAGSMHGAGFTLRTAGYGGNDADRDRADVIRLCVGDVAQPTDTESVRVLETQIDDMNPQFYGHVLDLLLEAGALDAFLTPVIMKKSRPGVLLTVLAPPTLADRLSEVIFKETTTIGIRNYPVSRTALSRSETTVETCYGAIRIKIARHGDSRRYTPEYEDCRQAARKNGLPLADVYAAVHQAAGRLDLDGLP